jgi:hypothetical protein
MAKYLFPLVFTLLFSACATTTALREDMIADLDPLPAGTIQAGVIQLFPTRVGPIPVPVTFEPRTNRVYLQFPYQTVTYRQYWDASSRAAFIAALSQYQGDYDRRELPQQSLVRTRKAYGSFSAMTEWGQFAFMINARSYPAIELGYAFQNDSPYFIVTQKEAPNVNAATDVQNNSLRITLYFTRAMAEELAALFDQEHLLSLLPEERQGAEAAPSSQIIPDEYTP